MILTIVLLCIIAVLAYTSINGLIKNEKYETIIENVHLDIKNTLDVMRKLDAEQLGVPIFEKDDQVGIIFSEIERLVKSLENVMQWEDEEPTTSETQPSPTK